MFENTTVDEAIAKGHKTVTYPGLLIMFICFGITFYFGLQKNAPGWIWGVGIISSILISWVFWSIKITKWKAWAFDSVRNVHELKKRAIQEKLIWPDNSIFRKTEIWNSSDKETWESLQNKFLQKDEFIYEEDMTVPSETIIYYSKGKNYVEMAIMLACLAVGIYFIVQTDKYILGTFLSLLGGFLSFKEFKEATNTEPQIILNEKGIQTVSTIFYEWKDIEDEDIEIQNSGKHTRTYLTYKHPSGTEQLLIDDYTIGHKELRRLLKIYKGRGLKNSGPF